MDIHSAILTIARRCTCVLSLGMLIGCSQTCTPVGAVGSYAGKNADHNYELHLAANRSGSLSWSGHSEAITWEWTNEQVFIKVSRNLFEVLGNHVPPDMHIGGAYVGLNPKCRRGKATELMLEDEHLILFRID